MSIYKKIANIQDKIQNIPKDGKNPHFSNTYATYEQVMEVLHPLLRKEGLMICHSFAEPTMHENLLGVTTSVIDIQEPSPEKPIPIEAMGARIDTTLYIPMTKNDPQMAGSAITYAKRYSVLAMFGLGTEDDDGNSASKPSVSSPKPATAPKEYDAAEAALCRIHQNPDGSAVKMTHYEKDGREWWSHKTANGGWCTGTATKYNREA